MQIIMIEKIKERERIFFSNFIKILGKCIKKRQKMKPKKNVILGCNFALEY